MRQLLRPKVIIPAIISLGILAALLAFGDIRKVVGLMASFQRIALLWFLLLMVAYEALRGLQWIFLLRALKIHEPLRAEVFAFMVGEAGKSLPIGNYFQSYLLSRSRDEDFGQLSAVSTMIILNEVAISLLGVLIIGVGSWTSWLRPVIVAGLVVIGAIAALLVKLHNSSRPPKWITERKSLRTALDEFRRFREGARDLLHPRIIAIGASIGALYLIVAASALYIVVLGLGISSLSLWQVWSVYFFSLAFALIVPIPVDIGAVEISGVGAFLAQGAQKPEAVSAMLINRVLSLGSAITIAVIGAIVLHDEFFRALRERPHKQQSDDRETSDKKPQEQAAS